jgi:hypothetical protein
MDLQKIKLTLEMMMSSAENPLYNPLETGFRHRPLSYPEQVRRYKMFSEEVYADCQAILKELEKPVASAAKNDVCMGPA